MSVCACVCVCVCVRVCVCVCVCVYHSLYVLTVSCTRYLSPEIGNCRQIVFLELQHNNLQALPDTIGNLLPSITYLNVIVHKCTQHEKVYFELSGTCA